MAGDRGTVRAFARVTRAAHQWADARATADRKWSSPLQAFHIAAYTMLAFGVATAAGVDIAGGTIIAAVGFVIAVASIVGDRQLSIRANMRKAYPTTLHCVVAYLTTRISDDEQATLGEQAPVHAILKQLEAHQGEAYALCNAYAQRTKEASGDAATELRGKHEEAFRLHGAMTAKLDDLRKHADALRQFFTAVRQQLASLVEPASAAGLDIRLARLKAAAAESEAAADAVIAANIQRLHGALDTAQQQLRKILVETGMAKAAALPSSGDGATDYGRIEQVVTSYIDRSHALDLTKVLAQGGVA